MAAKDWTEFVEQTSVVEALLRQDPAAVYAHQDFPTRDRYRREVEKLSRRARCDEVAVAHQVLALAGATSAAWTPPNTVAAPRDHVGYYLIDAGRPELEKALRCRTPWRRSWVDWILDHARAVYFGGIASVTCLIVMLLGIPIAAIAPSGSALILILAVLATLVPASELAMGIMHRLVTLLVPPRVLPKLSFPHAIPVESATFVVMPAMLLRRQSAAVLLQRLEIHYLSNPDSHLYFGLLTDFADAPHEVEPEDEEHLRAAVDGIAMLNQRYPGGGGDRFFLFHRRRLWNEMEDCWMGWERKRGKLIEFNRWLRGSSVTSFSTVAGDTSKLPPIRFVITLDADTQLPRESAKRLIGTLAHPLNRPRLDPDKRRVVGGYGVLQPRVTISLESAMRSRFARIYAGSAGIDPYVTAVSDVYQDLFGIGSYTGKGIYDVDAFAAATGSAFPENHILSHDLIEGNYARCGLVTDVEFLDEFPANFAAYLRREHRWIRGDWQILPWLLPTVPTAGEARQRNHLPSVERWKVFDNLRRSLVPPALVALLILGWTALPGAAWLWNGFVLLVLGWPALVQAASIPPRALQDLWRRPRPRVIPDNMPNTVLQVLLACIFLVTHAFTAIDAVGRTLLRIFWTRRQLLQWETSAATERKIGAGIVDFLWTMGASPLLALAANVLIVWQRPGAASAALPFLLAWLTAPFVAWWMSRPRPVERPDLTSEERHYLRTAARKTWSFFEAYVGDEDHWLPPDNFQEDPKGQVAHRTSPTNIGLYLLSGMTAHDLGYESLPSLLDRLDRSFATLDQLERNHGHFLNWYDTKTLRPLEPGYVSTVDSGNLLACLIALKQGLAEKEREPILAASVRDGLIDTLDVFEASLQALAPVVRRPESSTMDTLSGCIARIRRRLETVPGDLRAWNSTLEQLEQDTVEAAAAARKLGVDSKATSVAPVRWSERTLNQVRDRRTELRFLAPWLARLLEAPEEFNRSATVGATPEIVTAAEQWHALHSALIQGRSIADLVEKSDEWLTELTHLHQLWPTESGREWLSTLASSIRESSAADVQARCRGLAARIAAMSDAMDFRFLYNQQRHLFAVGFNLSLGRLDNVHYDLLASEACLTSFLAIARGEAPQKHWFQLGRLCTGGSGTLVLLSWGGTMFEYAMPRLMLRSIPATLLDASRRTAVRRHIRYGRQCGVPWGISESAFAAMDAEHNYQYQSFGVPGLGLKRGLANDLVIAPYATMLAAMDCPRQAVTNLRRLALEHIEGHFGFYEAVDYTKDRLAPHARSAVVRCYMAHHQGMALVALGNCLLGDPVPRRFHREPMVRATELLLQERVPASFVPVQLQGGAELVRAPAQDAPPMLSRRLVSPHTPHPRTHLISSGEYTVMVTNSGASRSTWRGLDITRWREDRTCDSWGQFYYLRDLRTGRLWSAGYQPAGVEADKYEVIYSVDKAEFHRIDGHIETRTEITISPETHAEIRQITLTNHDSRPHTIELTSYAELVLAPHAADLSHPAFGKLFLETEFIAEEEALVCRRRPRAPDQKPVFCVHVLAVEGPTIGALQYETDRKRFLGRGRTPAAPAAVEPGTILSGTIGSVLDPIVSLRRQVWLAPESSVRAAFTTVATDTREQAVVLADHYHDYHGVRRVFDLAWAQCQVELRHLRMTAHDAHVFQRLGACILYAGPLLRAAGEVMRSNRQGQPALWRYGISGDLPIVLVRVAEVEHLALVRELLAAHRYLRQKGLTFDLVVLNENEAGYFEDLQQQLQGLARGMAEPSLLDRPGGIFVRKAVLIPHEDQVLLLTASRCVLVAARGSLASQLDRAERAAAQAQVAPASRLRAHGRQLTDERAEIVARPRGLLFDNGIGGFQKDGREYLIYVPGLNQQSKSGVSELPPAPWINVVANPGFGFIVSETGAGFTWAGNSQTNRLTPWNNDPVADAPGEAVFIRDFASDEVWTPTPLPIRSAAPYLVRHGQGYTVFEHNSHQLRHELLLLVPPAEPIKLISLRLRNLSRRTRKLAIAFYAEWVLGTVRDQAPMNIVTEIDPESGALLARNAFNADFNTAVAFADVNQRPVHITGDRSHFLGRNGNVASPAGMFQSFRESSVGAALDPCAAIQTTVALHSGEEREIVFLLGQASNVAEARELLRRFREPGMAATTLRHTQEHWDRILGSVQVRTPNLGFNLLMNRWLLYQVLSCRVWGRSAFYQSSGAYGFRDQLQDVMALTYSAPAETRCHILRAAGRQFREGDVQHWWHVPSGAGVRTRSSDDFLWLPFVVAHYVATTGDAAMLEERVPFLQAPALRDDQHEDYRIALPGEEAATVYEHCLRAVEHGCRWGPHGLPLMGAGDWNDGMNRVGQDGRGESVWCGWFLAMILRDFGQLAESRGDANRAAEFRTHRERLIAALEEHAWDGRWYRQAFFDDGTPLGSQDNDECRIDSIAQTWAVISGAAESARARQAWASLAELLVRRDDRLILLFTPPFNQGHLEPGYIKGYLPGIRENGGQYTHAAAWCVLAAATLGQGTRAVELFDMLNPIHHTASPADVARYQVEPYALAADVYSELPHTGRGGWTWYTGSAGWHYRVALEAILGFRLQGNILSLNPCIPKAWPTFEVSYRYLSSTYHIRVDNPSRAERGVARIAVDGRETEASQLALLNDGKSHQVVVTLGDTALHST